MAQRIIDLGHEELLLPEFLIDAVAGVLAAYAAELELDQDDYDYQILVEFSNDLTQTVIQALRGRSKRD